MDVEDLYMFFSNCNKKYFLFFLTLNIFSMTAITYGDNATMYGNNAEDSEIISNDNKPQIDDNKSQFDETELDLLKKMLNEQCEKYLKIVLEHYKNLDFILEHIGQIINNNQLKINKEEAIQHIKFLRSIIQPKLKDSYVTIDPIQLLLLNTMFNRLLNHINIIVNNGLTSFPSIDDFITAINDDLEKTITRGLSGELDLETLEKQIQEHNQSLQKLDKKAQIIGLSRFNRLYRYMEKFTSDHRIVSRLGLGVAVGVGLYLLISRLDKESPVAKVPGIKQLHEIIGEKILFNKNTGEMITKYLDKDGNVLDKNTPSWLSALEGYLGEHRLGIISLTVPPLITWELFSGPLKNYWKDVQKTVAKRWESMRSYLRGGPLQKKIDYWKKEPKVGFKDIIGKEHHKLILSRIVNYFRNQETYDRSGIMPEAGYLLAGPKNTGKTFMAEAVAFEVKQALEEVGITDEFHFLSFTVAEIKEIGGFDILFGVARSYAPCVLFIDEIDMARLQRDGDADALSTILTQMSGIMNKETSRKVVVLAATNLPTSLDSALIRKGRFGQVLWFDYPTLQDRITYLKRQLENRCIMTIDESYIIKLAQETEKHAFEDLNAIIVTALQKAKDNGEVLTEEHLEAAFDEEIRGIQFEEVVIPEQEKQLIAVHQAGHALATQLFDAGEQITKVTIRPVKNEIKEEPMWAKYYDREKEKPDPIEYGKVFTSSSNNSLNLYSEQNLYAQCKIHLAGHIAEKIVFGSTGHTYHHYDKAKAVSIARYIVFQGRKEQDLPKKTREALLERAEQIVQECEASVTAAFEPHKETLQKITTALMEKLTLVADDINALVKPKTEAQKAA